MVTLLLVLILLWKWSTRWNRQLRYVYATWGHSVQWRCVLLQDDRRMNLQGRAATKKLVMLPTVLSHLKKWVNEFVCKMQLVNVILIDLHDVFRSDLLTSFIKCGICSALADWLQPLPDHSLPHMKIREGILDALGSVSSTITSTCSRL